MHSFYDTGLVPNVALLMLSQLIRTAVVTASVVAITFVVVEKLQRPQTGGRQ